MSKDSPASTSTCAHLQQAQAEQRLVQRKSELQQEFERLRELQENEEQGGVGQGMLQLQHKLAMVRACVCVGGVAHRRVCIWMNVCYAPGSHA